MATQQSAKLGALELWRHTLVASVRGNSPDLSARQMALLLSVYMGEGPHTVRGLAAALKISKPAVSRALDRLGELGYIRRQRDELDRRNVLVQRTVAGAVFLNDFAALVMTAQDHVAALPNREVQFVIDPPPAMPALESFQAEADADAETEASQPAAASWVEAA